ncbi:TIGR03083 family protein [Amycolatopsis xylanica]|uniref:TIGR03083 family protein n=1 Tax=Amycolatopsis xylanica TaxID=589385 RepID=A0A1H3HIE2_9PSEU|nr:maleylpyruvate isomerase family mycothiol-dependent enzyme [Amycolatopsis xylanica]SDY15313.1 TIGR03083 family protein [Amycolatopsis xylanica]
MQPAEYLPHLRHLVGEFERVVRTGDADAPVPSCGDWRLRDLAIHLGNVHLWATKIIITGEPQPQEFDSDPGSELADWYGNAARGLLEALGDADPAAPGWHFGQGEKVKAFWFRRQTQEVAVHLFDAAAAVGEHLDLPPVVAADGIDEVLTTMLPRVTRWHAPPPLTTALSLRATDTGDEWFLAAVEAGEVPAVAEAGGEPGSTAQGTAQDLLLLLWQRYSIDSVELSGDTAAATAFLTSRMTP